MAPSRLNLFLLRLKFVVKLNCRTEGLMVSLDFCNLIKIFKNRICSELNLD